MKLSVLAIKYRGKSLWEVSYVRPQEIDSVMRGPGKLYRTNTIISSSVLIGYLNFAVAIYYLVWLLEVRND